MRASILRKFFEQNLVDTRYLGRPAIIAATAVGPALAAAGCAGLVLEALALLALPRLLDTASRPVSRLLRIEIGVYEDKLAWWRGPEQLRALSCLAHPDHPQFKKRSRP